MSDIFQKLHHLCVVIHDFCALPRIISGSETLPGAITRRLPIF